MPKEVKCMTSLGYAANAILYREVVKPQSIMFRWSWIILDSLTKLFLNRKRNPFSSLELLKNTVHGPSKEMCLPFSGRNTGFGVRLTYILIIS